MPSISPGVLSKLREFDTPTVCNLIELFESRPRNEGYMDARIRACFPEMKPIVGFASTATFRSAKPPRAGDAYSGTNQQAAGFKELSGPAIVVFQDLDDPAAGATFGEVMCSTYKAFGAVGLITSGAGRDLDQVRAIQFPVFTSGTICSHGYNHIPQIGVPVRVGGLTVYPDDMLHADCNGVASVPKGIAAEVADIGDEFMKAEAILIEAARNDPSEASLAEARRAYGEIVSALKRRVSRAAV